MKKNQWVWISLLVVVLLSAGVYAQDGDDAGDTNNETTATEASTEATSSDNDSSSEEGVRLEEAVFALIAVAIVMAGLIGFEFIHRQKRTD